MSWRAVLLLSLLVGLLLPAQSEDWRKEITAAYARAGEAARLKFLPGLLGNRGSGYRLFSPNGEVDVAAERLRFRELLAPATQVRFDTKILQGLQTGDSIQCVVSQVMQFERPDPATNELFTLAVHTRATEKWTRVRSGWRLTETRVHSQDLVRGPKLTD